MKLIIRLIFFGWFVLPVASGAWFFHWAMNEPEEAKNLARFLKEFCGLED